MPYKDTEKRREAVRKSNKKWAAKNREHLQKQQHFRHEEQLAKRREYMRQRRRRLGAKERPKGPNARVELIVPATNKWRVFTDRDGITRIYFTSKRGFDLKEISDIVREFKAMRKSQIDNLPPNTPP